MNREYKEKSLEIAKSLIVNIMFRINYLIFVLTLILQYI